MYSRDPLEILIAREAAIETWRFLANGNGYHAISASAAPYPNSGN